MVADDDDEAIRTFFLDFLDKFRKFAVSIPVMAEFFQKLFILLMVLGQGLADRFAVKALGIEVKVVRRMI